MINKLLNFFKWFSKLKDWRIALMITVMFISCILALIFGGMRIYQEFNPEVIEKVIAPSDSLKVDE